MAYQQKEGQGSLFKNDKKNDRQPDFKGTIMIKGVTYAISAWNRTSQSGLEYLSLQAEEKTQDGQGYQNNGGYQARQVPPKPTIPPAMPPQEADMPDFGDEGDLPF